MSYFSKYVKVDEKKKFNRLSFFTKSNSYLLKLDLKQKKVDKIDHCIDTRTKSGIRNYYHDHHSCPKFPIIILDVYNDRTTL